MWLNVNKLNVLIWELNFFKIILNFFIEWLIIEIFFNIDWVFFGYVRFNK